MGMYNARAVGSSYSHMSREAAAQCRARVSTPRSLKHVLKPEASTQVREARDMPAERMHECLDIWEIDCLADMCRSIRHFGEEASGLSSEYSRAYQGIEARKPHPKSKIF